MSVFNISGNVDPVRNSDNNRYTATKSGVMNNDGLIKFIEATILVKHTIDKPAALLLDSLGYQHNDRTTQTCDKQYNSV